VRCVPLLLCHVFHLFFCFSLTKSFLTCVFQQLQLHRRQRCAWWHLMLTWRFTGETLWKEWTRVLVILETRCHLLAGQRWMDSQLTSLKKLTIWTQFLFTMKYISTLATAGTYLRSHIVTPKWHPCLKCLSALFIDINCGLANGIARAHCPIVPLWQILSRFFPWIEVTNFKRSWRRVVVYFLNICSAICDHHIILFSMIHYVM